MPVFSFRAECDHDVKMFADTLNKKGIQFHIESSALLLDTKPEPKWMGDMKAELKVNMTLREVRLAMAEQDDAHVMIQSVRELPLNENHLGRDDNIDWGDPATF